MKKILALLLFYSLALSVPAQAFVVIPDEFFPCFWVGGGGPHKKLCSGFSTPGQLISSLLPNVIVLAGVIFFVLILYYGYRMIQLADTHSPQDLAKAQAATTMSAVGFLLVVSSYFILQLLETTLGIKIINPIF